MTLAIYGLTSKGSWQRDYGLRDQIRRATVVGFRFTVVGCEISGSGAPIMASFKKFEDIEAWQNARRLTLAIYGLTSKGSWQRDYGLRDQIRRASVSVMSNVAEGFARESNKEFHRFLTMARGSVGEVKSHLYIARDLFYVEQSDFDDLYEQADRIARQLTGLMNYLKA